MDIGHQVAARFLETHADAAARILETVPVPEVTALLAQSDPAAAAEVLRRMAPAAAAEVLGTIAVTAVGALLAALPVETAAALLRRLETERRAEMLQEAPAAVALPVRRLLAYPEGTAGAFMDPFPVILPDDITAGEAIERVRQASSHLYFYVYVVARTGRLAGVLDLRELALADEATPLASFMRSPVAYLPAGADLAAVLAHPGWREYDALPVVEEGGTLVGVIRYRTLRRLVGDPGPTPALLSVALEIGELYWTGLSGLLRDLAFASPPRQDAPTAEEPR